MINNSDYDKPLVIIDMQNHFFKRNKKEMNVIKERVKKVAKLCKIWMQSGLPIILVEYNLIPHGVKTPSDIPTTYDIRKTIKNYNNVIKVIKNSDDGSQELIDAFEKMNVNPKEIHVCGVNLPYCVYYTVLGMICRAKHICVNLYKHISFNVKTPNDLSWDEGIFRDLIMKSKVYGAKLEINDCPIID